MPTRHLRIRRRPKWQRVLNWPINFWKCFRIKGVLRVSDRAKVAVLMANVIAKN